MSSEWQEAVSTTLNKAAHGTSCDISSFLGRPATFCDEKTRGKPVSQLTQQTGRKTQAAQRIKSVNKSAG
jgi:hypothetical protein